MAFPYSATLLDDFNRANSIGSLGSNWTTVQIIGSSLSIVSNEVNTQGGLASNYWNVTTFADDHACYCTITGKPGIGLASGLHVRGSNLDSAVTCSLYQLQVVTAAGADTWQIDKVVAGVYTPAIISGGTQEITNGDLIGLAIVGNRLDAYYSSDGGASWSNPLGGTDNSIATGGQIALFGSGAGPNSTYDNFNGGNAAVAAAPVADFIGTPLSGVAPLSVSFTDLSTNTPTSWLWEYSPDGGITWGTFTNSTQQNPTQVFT